MRPSLRRGHRHVHARRDRRRLQRQRARLVRDPDRRDARAGLARGRRLRQLQAIFNDPLVRDPFLSVFLWTFVYAGVSVLLTFALGLFLAVTLNKSGLRLRRTQRALLVIPYAIRPSSGARLGRHAQRRLRRHQQHLGIHVPWLFDASWAKVSCILVNFWLGFPYFFLVCTGALQAIPDELSEAARVDGASGPQVFRKVTFPLLLVAVAPL